MAGLKREACSHDQPWSGGKTRIGKKPGRVQNEPSLESRFEKDVKKNFRVNFRLDKPATYYNFVKDPFKSYKNMREGIYYLRP